MAKDLVDIQLGKAPKHNIDDFMGSKYVQEVKKYTTNQGPVKKGGKNKNSKKPKNKRYPRQADN